MTADDNRSTSGASAAALPLPESPSGTSVLAAMVAGNLEAAAAYGLPARELAAQAGIDPRDLADPDGRVPFDSHVRLWQAIDADPRAQDFGFWLGANVSLRMLGVVGFAMQHAPDVRAAFGCLERYRRLINDQVSPIIDELPDRVVFRRAELPEIARLATIVVAAPVGTLTLLRELTGVSASTPLALEAAFQHPAPANVERYYGVLGCPIAFNAPETRIALRREAFALPVRRPDPGLFAYLERHASALQARVADRQSLSARIREAIVGQLSEGEPSQALLARQLALSERTLQRRLRDEGTSFAALLEQIRSELSLMYLSDDALAIFEVAYLLGYSEPSAFNRAFKRWTGQSPREYRGRAP
jgi:AraC-like DNA-binding protein